MRSQAVGIIGRVAVLLSIRVVASAAVIAISLALIAAGVKLTTTTTSLEPVRSPSPDARYASTHSAAISDPYSPPISAAYPAPTDPISFPPYVTFSPPDGAGTPRFQLTCSLPVYRGTTGSGGFMQFPSGNFVADPTSAVSLPGPIYSHASWLTYDRAFSRWLPVPYLWISPDGSHYTYPAGDGVSVVNVAATTQTVLGQGHSWEIVSVGAQGVYARMTDQPGALTLASETGLWLLSFSGDVQQITPSGFWQAVTQSYAYGTKTYPVSAPGLGSDSVIRLDLTTGVITDLFTRPSVANIVVRGLDAHGDPVIYVDYQYPPGAHETWIASGPTDAYPVFGSPEGLSTNQTSIADEHGVWFRVGYPAYGLALFVPGSGLYWMSSSDMYVAGTCV